MIWQSSSLSNQLPWLTACIRIALARPVYVAFEVDRFRVVAAADIDPSAIQEAPVDFRSLPWTGPIVIAAVKPTDPAEVMKSIELGLNGLDLSMIPGNWRPYSTQCDLAWNKARSVRALFAKYPATRDPVVKASAAAGQAWDSLRFLPLVSRQASWVAILAAPDARIVGYVPVDGFF